MILNRVSDSAKLAEVGHTVLTMAVGMLGATVKIGGFIPRAVASMFLLGRLVVVPFVFAVQYSGTDVEEMQKERCGGYYNPPCKCCDGKGRTECTMCDGTGSVSYTHLDVYKRQA